MPTELYFDADQYEMHVDRVKIKRGAYFYPWQVAIKVEADGRRVASIKPGRYALRGAPEDAPFKFIMIVSADREGKLMPFEDREFIMNRQWSGETCCLKKRPQPGEDAGVMGYADFGVITTNRFPIDVWRRDGSLAGHYDTIDALLAAGWIVD